MADKQIVRVSTPLLDGTTTSDIIGGQTEDFGAISSAILYVPAGLVVNTEITHDTIGANLPTPVWVRPDGATGPAEIVISEPCTAIRVTRVSGTGTVRGEVLQGATITTSGGGGGGGGEPEFPEEGDTPSPMSGIVSFMEREDGTVGPIRGDDTKGQLVNAENIPMQRFFYDSTAGDFPQPIPVAPGAAGTLTTIFLPYRNISNEQGNTYGSFGDGTLQVTGTALTTEVAANTADGALTNGQYWVDYKNGRIRAKKADSSTTIDVNFYVNYLLIGLQGDNGGGGGGGGDEGGFVEEGDAPTPFIGLPVFMRNALNEAVAFIGDTTNGLTVNLGTNNDVTVTGTVAVSGTSAVGGNVAAAATDSGNPVKIGAVYNTVKPTYTDGQRVDLQAESDGSARVFTTNQPQAVDNDVAYNVIGVKDKPVIGTKYAYNRDISGALESNTVSSSSPCNWHKTRGLIDASAPSATYYWLTMDAASLPADGAVTLLCTAQKIVHVTGTDSFFEIDNGVNCIPAATGLVSCLSSTQFTKTLVAGLYAATTVFYKN